MKNKKLKNNSGSRRCEETKNKIKEETTTIEDEIEETEKVKQQSSRRCEEETKNKENKQYNNNKEGKNKT